MEKKVHKMIARAIKHHPKIRKKGEQKQDADKQKG
jgi:hypothetical protein